VPAIEELIFWLSPLEILTLAEYIAHLSSSQKALGLTSINAPNTVVVHAAATIATATFVFALWGLRLVVKSIKLKQIVVVCGRARSALVLF
jgi:hypothetical protein